MKRFSIVFLVSAVVTVGLDATSARAQLVVANDQTSGQIWVIDLNPGGTGTRQLVTGTTAQVWGMAADNNNGILYWADAGNTLYKATMAATGTLTPELVGTLAAGATNIQTVQGMAYDSTDNILYLYRNSGGTGLEGFYSVDVTTAACTLVHAVPATGVEFSGFDYNPVDDSFYACTDLAGAPFAAADVWRFPKPINTATAVFVTDYPAGDADIDGIGIGNNKLYLVNDNNTPPAGGGHYVYDLATNAFEAHIPFEWPAGSVTFAGGAWAPALVVPAIGTNLQITKTDSPDPVVLPGGNITYNITVTNLGPEPATGVAVSDTLPGNVTFVSVDAPGVHNAGVITATIGDLAASASVSFNVVVQGPATPDTVSNTATVTGNETDPQPSNNSATASTTIRNPQANLGVVITDPADCSVGVGGTVTYTVTVTNVGPEAANNVVVVNTLPDDATFLSSNPAGTPVGNTLTINLGNIAPAGNAVLTIDVSPTAAVTLTNSASATADEEDPTPANNTDSETTQILGGGPTSATIKGVISTIAASPTSDVPGLSPGKFASSATTGASLARPFRSPDGTKWIMRADTDIATNDVVMLVYNGTALTVVAQEGVTNLPTGGANPPQPWTSGGFDDVYGINDSGQYTFSGVLQGAAATDGYIVKWDGAQFVLIGQEATTAAPGATGGTTFGGSRGSARIANDGTVSFYQTINGLTTTTDSFLLKNDGATVVAQEGVTVPTNQGGGTTNTSKAFDAGTTDGQGFFPNAAGDQYIYSGTINTTALPNDRVAVVGNGVVIQENFVLPGTAFVSSTDDSSPINQVWMESDGTWFAYGDNNDDIDWVLRNGVVVAETDTEIFPTAGENWDDAPYAQTFFYAVGNNNGDYAVGGTTNAANGLANAVIVMNGTTLVARENDPVDLDNDGVFNDDVFIRTFLDDYAFMTNSDLYVVVRLRSSAAALCGATDTDIGQALIRIPIGGTGPLPCCKGDIDGSAQVDELDINEFIAQLVLDVGGDPCPLSAADVNNDTVVDGLDISPFVDLILANGGDGTVCP